MKKVLFIASHRMGRAPGQRFRFEQYFTFLENAGFTCELSFLVSEKDDIILYRKGRLILKALLTIKWFLKRAKDKRRIKEFDIVFVFREALMTGSILFEKAIKKHKAKFIFDFDDSIWLPNVSDANKRFVWLKDAEKTSKLIKLADMVFAGNNYLAAYASKFNNNVKIIPTTIDTEKYSKSSLKKSDNNKICIGWSGSITTIMHFEYAIPFLRKIKVKYGNDITFKVIGDSTYRNEELNIIGISWNEADEIKELSGFDIGIMPLPDDEWAKGKCGLKGLQYMALEIPTIMSPVGVNTEIIQDGVNGFLAVDIDEWVEKLSLLIESIALREKLGNAARQTVLEKYSLESQKQHYLNYFQELIKK
jgi:glycosyltransferase involved in cell wall biosynthesis